MAVAVAALALPSAAAAAPPTGRYVALGASYVDTYTPSIGRDACRSASVRWVEGLIPGNSAAPFHPNAAGEHGMANAVVARLNA